MELCKCSKEKEFGILETQVHNLEIRSNELYIKIKENRDSLKLIEKVSLDIAMFAQQMVNLTEEIKYIKLDLSEVKRYPADYHEMKTEYTRQKKIVDNLEHYKKLAIGAIILALIGAFITGLKISVL